MDSRQFARTWACCVLLFRNFRDHCMLGAEELRLARHARLTFSLRAQTSAKCQGRRRRRQGRRRRGRQGRRRRRQGRRRRGRQGRRRRRQGRRRRGRQGRRRLAQGRRRLRWRQVDAHDLERRSPRPERRGTCGRRRRGEGRLRRARAERGRGPQEVRARAAAPGPSRRRRDPFLVLCSIMFPACVPRAPPGRRRRASARSESARKMLDRDQ